nr:hypothetical protein [Tanacetum cinerariifolium]
MLRMAKNVIVAGADNRPPMLDKTQYSSWASRMLLYIKGKEHGKLLYDSVINGPFKYRTVTLPETQTTPTTVRDRTYDKHIDAEKIREACDIKATKIVLQGLPQDIYNMVNHHSEAKDIWDRVKLLIKAKDLHNTNFDRLYGYLRQHEAHVNEEPQIMQRYPDPLVYNSSPSYTNQTQYHQQISSIDQAFYSRPAQQQLNNVPMVQQRSYQAPVGLVVPSFLPTDDLIASLNKPMAFIGTSFTSRYPPTNNQIRTSSNLRNRATIQDDKVTV